MVTRNVSFASESFYHVYNRGTDKRIIYLDSRDYKRFIELLYLCNSHNAVNMRDTYRDFSSVYKIDRGDLLVAIGAYCLMPNHFHILVTPLCDEGVSLFMKKLSTSYSMYFNKRHERSGGLFQGRFKAQYADSDEYLKYLYAYIHLNPVKLIDPSWKEEGIKDAAKSFDFAASFQYSSLQDYLGQDREEKVILNRELFPGYFQTAAEHQQELFEWLTYNNENIIPTVKVNSR